MTLSLGFDVITLSTRFQQKFIHEAGWQFSGTLQPVEDMKIYSDDYFQVRQILRVFSKNGVKAGDVVQDMLGQRYILGEYDLRQHYEGFRMYPVTQSAVWKRETSKVDQLTGLKKSIGLETKGTIWITGETVSREARGGDILVREEVFRVVTGSAVELGDTLNDHKVIKVHATLGVRVLELQ